MLRFTSRTQVPFSGRVAGTGFAAGFLATPTFHQLMLAFLSAVGLTTKIPFSFAHVPPFAVPAVFSLAFWGGLWGVAFAWGALLLAKKINYWLFALLFGAIAPTIVGWFVSAPLHGDPLGGGWHLPNVVTSILINAAWGAGTGLLLRLLSSRHDARV